MQGRGGGSKTHTQEGALHTLSLHTFNSHNGLLQLCYVVLASKQEEQRLGRGGQLARPVRAPLILPE